MTLACRSDPRRDAVRSEGRNGLDYIEVVDGPPTRLYVYFLGKLPKELAKKKPGLAGYLQLTGGDRITGLQIIDVTPQAGIDAQHDDFLLVTVDRVGDFSTYTLTLTGVEGIDPRYSAATFTFRVDCASDIDCKPACACEPAAPDEPTINHLAKDYASFRQLIFDRMATLVPQWTERHVSDIGVALVELLAYVGDYLSYYQDAVATEAYLGTARQRISVRRHVRLVDYVLHEGCNARAWVCLEVSDKVRLRPIDMAFVTDASRGVGSLPSTLAAEQLRSIPASTYEYFEPLADDPTHAFEFRPSHNAIPFYTWGRRECCLQVGSTSATLLDHWQTGTNGSLARALNIGVNDVLIFEEVLGARTGVAADADPTRRWAVRVTDVQLAEDSVYPVTVGAGEAEQTLPTPLIEVTWAAEDALPFSFCVSAIGAPAACTYLTDISVAHGNVVLVDHGRTLDPEPLDPVPGVVGASCCECEGHPSDVRATTGRYRPNLREAPLTFRESDLPESKPATTALAQDPRKAIPFIRLTDDEPAEWNVRPDLLASSADDRDFVVEVDNDAVAHLRFGDGALGRSPDLGRKFVAVYRVGCGTAGNVGAEAISQLVLKGLKLDGISITVCNPLAATGGVDPEPIAEAKLFAPKGFRDGKKILRAITANDYATLAARNPKLQGAMARLAWTGSWYEADVAVDPLKTEVAGKRLLETIEHDLHKYRRMGHDLRVQPAAYVPIELSLRVCALRGFDRGHVKAALSARFSNRINGDGTKGFFHADNLRFGEDLHLSEIIAAAQAVPGVECVTVERFHRRFESPNSEIANGVLPLGPGEIAQLDNDPDFTERGLLHIVIGGGR